MEIKQKLMECCDGIQHIGIPVEDMEKTCAFYESLGFENVYQTVIGESQKLGFLKFGNLFVEVYEEAETVKTAGAINHIAINCTDVKKAYEMAVEQGYRIVSNGIESLPLWENGVSYFIIEGPNNERIELNQRFQ